MHKPCEILTCCLLLTLLASKVSAFDFEVECDEAIASEQTAAARYQKYIGQWAGIWTESRYMKYYPADVQQAARGFDYIKLEINIIDIKICDVEFELFWGTDPKEADLQREEVMTEEGYYLYWNGLDNAGTYILDLDEANDRLDGVFQMNSGQNIAEISMERSLRTQ